jgi:integral membrane sensor domain MASE1
LGLFSTIGQLWIDVAGLTWLRRMKHLAVRRRVLVYVMLPLAYVITGRLGLLLAVPPGYATAVFVAAGIAVGAVFMAGPSTLPGVFIGSLLLNLWVGYSIAGHFELLGTAAALVRRGFRTASSAWRRRASPCDRLSRWIG